MPHNICVQEKIQLKQDKKKEQTSNTDMVYATDS